VQKIERGEVRDLVSSIAAGRVAAKKEVTLRAEIGGTVLRLHHRRGELVPALTPLVAFDAEDLKDRFRIAQLSVALGRAQAAQAITSASVAGNNAARVKLLQQAGALPISEMDSVLGQYEIALKSSDVALATIAQGQANVELAKTALKKAVVTCPFAATVLTTNIEEGDVLVPGTPLLTLADASELHVDADIDEADIARVKVGMYAELSFDAFPDRLRGVVTEVAPSVTRDLRGNRSVAVKVGLPRDARMLVGMSADVDVVVLTREGVVWVPPGAVMGRGAERAVYVIENDIARRRKIEVGISTWEAVEITKGIVPGDRVVTTLAVAGLEDGARVFVEGEAVERPNHVGLAP
jgi:RND family efflux transporter MFP subunit